MSLREDIIRDEGDKPYAYQDSLGVWTCSVGFNIDRDHGGTIPPQVRDFWLDFLIAQNRAELLKELPWIAGRPDSVQEGLENMFYNLKHRLYGFSKMLSALHAGDYTTASQEALDSAWATQVGDRAKRIAALFMAGAGPNG